MFTGGQIVALYLVLALLIYAIINRICNTISEINYAKYIGKQLEDNTKYIQVNNKEDLDAVLKEIEEVTNNESEEE